MKKIRRVKLGKALNTSDDVLDLESMITPADIEAARIWAERYGSGAFVEMLRTEKEGND